MTMPNADREAAPRSLWEELHGTWLRQSPLRPGDRSAPSVEDEVDEAASGEG